MPVMRAMVFDGPGQPLHARESPVPRPGPGELLIEVSACGVCRTDLHVADGEIAAQYPIVPGHEIVGRVVTMGADVKGFADDDRVGVPWLGSTCGRCPYCRGGRENLCDHPQFTGATRDGGYATHVIADARFCFALPARFSDVEAAPLLCAGLIGWRALRLAGPGRRIGLYGFGAAAHLLAQIAIAQGRDVYAFTRDDDTDTQTFARSLGCVWAGGSSTATPAPLDAALIFAPVGALVPLALKAVKKGGRVVCAGIHMSDIPSFPYADLWEEREILSVANLTREDGETFFAAIGAMPLKIITETFALDDANVALERLRAGAITGAAVILPRRDAQSPELSSGFEPDPVEP
ncbi:alcohol dehydrogenase, propanol-preferring [Sphingomonas sp. NFR15]|nr:alcohol dehydrogenase, propanol-preferring [Sphingomonas sp. NFR15]